MFVGVDCGALHLCRCTDTPAVALWTRGFAPYRALPRRDSVNLVPAPHHANRYRRVPYNLVEYTGEGDGDWVTEQAVRVLRGGATDCLFRHLLDKVAEYADRHTSLGQFFRLLPPSPTVVETGSIRCEEDWSAGFFTYLCGLWSQQHGGRLHSVERDPRKADFARAWTRQFATVEVHTRHSHDFLKVFRGSIDGLYLDSQDTYEPGHEDTCVEEARLALPHLSRRGLILIDDTPHSGGNWHGKGEKAVPFLLDHGYHVLYAGHQVLLSKARSGDAHGL